MGYSFRKIGCGEVTLETTVTMLGQMPALKVLSMLMPKSITSNHLKTDSSAAFDLLVGETG